MSIPHPAIWNSIGVSVETTTKTFCQQAEELECKLLQLIDNAMECPVGQEIEFDGVKFEKRTDYVKAVRDCISFLRGICDEADACYQYIPLKGTARC